MEWNSPSEHMEFVLRSKRVHDISRRLCWKGSEKKEKEKRLRQEKDKKEGKQVEERVSGAARPSNAYKY